MRGVYLGTKSIEGSMGLATHWAIGMGNGPKLIWMEEDGDGGHTKKSIVGRPPSTATMRALGALGLPNF